MCISPVDVYGKCACKVKLTLYIAMKAKRGCRYKVSYCTLTLTLSWRVGGQRHAPAHFIPVKEPIPIL
jgi:hypothetical protein